MRRPDFPAAYARTRRFTNGVPRSVQVAADGSRTLFLRSSGPEDPVHALWLLEHARGIERCVADLSAPTAAADEPAEERARRERARESGAGIVAYSATPDLGAACFAVSGRLYVVDVAGGGEPRELAVTGPVVDPRIAPSGTAIAYVHDGALWVTSLDGAATRLVGEDDLTVTWGLAEHIAAEEMDRLRGHWWAPDAHLLLAARVDVSAVPTWYVADASDPSAPPQPLRYPAAGAANADVSLAFVSMSGDCIPVEWDRDEFPYLARVSYTEQAPVIQVQARDQRTVQVLRLDPATGATSPLRTDTDPIWVELVPGAPTLAPDGRLVSVVDDGETRRLWFDERAVTPPGLQVRAVRGLSPAGVLITASTDPVEVHVHLVRWDGAVEAITTNAGVHDGWLGGDTIVLHSATLDTVLPTLQVHGPAPVPIASTASEPDAIPRATLVRLGERELAAAVLFPDGHEPGTRLPVILDPYGGPHAQRVLARGAGFAVSRWIADQGFAVVVADGRGTPGRGPAWEREIAGDLATAPLQDQVDALQAACAHYPDLDPGRVGIRGWSFGGYLALLAILRRPDVFTAAVAGAPVTDWRLYDTHYTERYLGRPDADPDAYQRSSVLADAAKLSGALLILHGLNDDNVVAAHSIRLSQELLLAGRRHDCLLLPGITHMASDPQVASALLRTEIEFFWSALSAGPPARS
jgi:dipeptidyl-peptidase-4